MTRLHVNGATLLRAVAAATANLERHVEEVDALNVFPVPDGDTGSNMLATMRAALAEAELLPPGQRDLDSVAEALSRGALTGARGNSGVILSQIIRGMTERADGRRRADGTDLAMGLRLGSQVAYGSVLTPVEGTILTVIRDAADAAEAAAGRQPHVEAVLADVIEAAASSVQRTPTLLPVLDDAGVVDSGGQGLFRVLEGMLQVGQRDGQLVSAPRLEGAAASFGPDADDPHAGHRRPHPDVDGQHGYETQYLVDSAEGRIDVDTLRVVIQGLGDSVVVAGDAHRTRIHVHGDRPDLAIAAGLPYGRLSQIEIRDLDSQVAHAGLPAPSTARTVIGRAAIAMVAVGSAPGVADVLASLGCHVVRPAEGMRPSVGEITAAIAASGASEIVVLPNDRDAVLAADLVASRSSSVNVKVVATRNAAEGIAAALVFDATLPADQNAERMATEAAALRSFNVITAAKDSVVDGQAITLGDVIAFDADRRLMTMGPDVETVTVRALATFDAYELVTLYLGAGEWAERERRLRDAIVSAVPEVEVEIVRGGQAGDGVLVAVE